MGLLLFAPCIALLLAPLVGLVYFLWFFCFVLPREVYHNRKLDVAYEVAKPLADAYYSKPERERTKEETAALNKARCEYNKRVHKVKAYTAHDLHGRTIYHPGFYELPLSEQIDDFLYFRDQ